MIYIALGSNLGNRLDNLRRAVDLIKETCIPELRCSIIIETEAIVLSEAPEEYNKPFLNMIAFGDCALSPHQLLEQLQKIEHILGKPKIYDKWSPRIIDLDILFFNDEVINTTDLTVPHREIKNREFLKHLLKAVGMKNLDAHMPEAYKNNLVFSPKLVGIVNITPDSFSDGGEFSNTETAVARCFELAQDGASIVEIGAQSTRPGAKLIGPEAEYAILAPVLDALQGSYINISIDTFEDDVVRKIIDKYDVHWVNDVKGDLNDDILKIIADRGCSIVVMHSLSVPARKDICISNDRLPIATIMDWAKKKIDHLIKCGFNLDKIIVDPGIGFSKSSYQDISLLRDVEQMRELGCQSLIGHSRKSFMRGFVDKTPSERDIETIAISQLLKDKADYLRVHNVRDHMRFFVAQEAIIGAR